MSKEARAARAAQSELKLGNQRFLELTDQPGIRPARYMHRFHWVTVVKVASMDEAYLRELIQWSYDTALSALPKKVQREIRGGDS